LVFGCGNPLFGDDGFAAEVIRHLEDCYPLPTGVELLDVGTAIRDFLLDILLLSRKPSQMVIIDAMDIGGAVAGEIQEITVNDVQPAKISDFSLHQFPTVNMLKEIAEYTDIDVRILVVKPEKIPNRVGPGLSPKVKMAVDKMCHHIMQILTKPLPSTTAPAGKAFGTKVSGRKNNKGGSRRPVAGWNQL
jgi:coenzyme F420 hydrogenase subunit delta